MECTFFPFFVFLFRFELHIFDTKYGTGTICARAGSYEKIDNTEIYSRIRLKISTYNERVTISMRVVVQYDQSCHDVDRTKTMNRL